MALSVGTNPRDSSVPKKYTECTFGKWYYGAGQENNHLESYKGTERIHKNLHDTYNEIFNEFEKISAEGFFEDISLRDSLKQKEFNASIDKLKNISKELLGKLAELQAEF
ncbi:MAG: hypothetical protein DRI94_11180 [Bacteroidetes bacterium]|nr:MAG: hypothetical protein DRI94_11180 [Bacteroidota bacterium]